MKKKNFTLIQLVCTENPAKVPFLSVYGEEAKIGHTSRKYQIGRSHMNAITAQVAPNTTAQTAPKIVRLEQTAFMLQNVHDKMLEAVWSKDDVFVKFKDQKGKIVACRAYLQGKKIYLSYQKIPDDIMSLFIPVAVLATAVHPPCMKLYTDFVNKEDISTVYQFCDEAHYGFLQACDRQAEATDNLSMEAMAQAVNSGYYSAFPFLDSPIKGSSKPRKAQAKEQQKNEENKGKDITAYRNGEHIVKYEWGEEQKKRIIPLDFLDTFVPVPKFFQLMNKLDMRIGQNMVGMYECGLVAPEDIRRDIVNVLLYGNPGTGKTVLAHALSAATGMPLYEVKFDKYTESDEVEGKNKIVSGKLTFTETDFLEGYEKGGILLLEEINCADQNVLTGALNNAIEYPFFIMKDGYQKVNRNPFTVIIATMNVGTEGTMWLNQSFASRFKQKYRIADPSRENFIRFLTNYGYARDASEYVYDAYVKVMDLLKANRTTAEYSLNLSTRSCLGALENMSEGDDAKTALIDTVVGAIGIVDPQAAMDIEKNVIANLPDFNEKAR